LSDAADAARALQCFTAISDDDPRLQEFREAVIQDIAVRPSPVAASEEDHLSRVEAKLDEILVLLRGGPPQ
jgi:hypothetical protein